MPQISHHAPDLTVTTFAKFEDEVGAFAIALLQRERDALRAIGTATAFVIQNNATFKFGDIFNTQRAAHGDFVTLVHAIARMRETIGKVAIICQQHQT